MFEVFFKNLLVALQKVCDILKSTHFKSPDDVNYEARLSQNTEIRDQVRRFLPAVQNRVDSEWLEK